MMLVAQQVRAPAGSSLVNIYGYRHDPPLRSDWWLHAWTAAEKDLVRVARVEAIEAGGNRVESFLDLVSPDDTPAAELTAWARDVLSTWPDPVGFPLCVIEGALGVRFGCDETLHGAWRNRALALLDALTPLANETH